MSEKRLVHINSRSSFTTQLQNLYNLCVVFIKDTQEVYTHGTFYSIPKVYKDKIDSAYTNAEIDALIAAALGNSGIVFNETKVSKITYETKTYDIYQNTISVDPARINKTAGETTDFIISYDPLGKDLYMNLESLIIQYSGHFLVDYLSVSEFYIDSNNYTHCIVKCNKTIPQCNKILMTVQYIKDILSFTDIEFTVNLPQGTTLSDLSITFPTLKYNKKFAFSWTVDDSLTCVYNKLFQYINKKWVDDSYTWHDGMAHTTGSYAPRYLTFSNGTELQQRFKLDTAFNSFSRLGTDEIHSSGYAYSNLRWTELVKFLEFGNTIQNHGGGDETKPHESLYDNEAKIFEKTGYNPFMCIIPGGTTGFEAECEAADFIFHYNLKDGQKNSLASLTKADFAKKTGIMRRIIYDTKAPTALENFKTEISGVAQRTDFPWIYYGGHVIADDKNPDGTDKGQIYWNPVVKPLFDWLFDNYGSMGNDSIWFAGPSEIYEYLYTRVFSNVIIVEEGPGLLRVKVRHAALQPFINKDFSLIIQSLKPITCNTLKKKSTNVVYFAARNIDQNTVLANINFDTTKLQRAEKYTRIHELDINAETYEDAMYFISQLDVELQDPFKARLTPIVHPEINTMVINQGATSTTSRTVSIAVTYTGTITGYMISESPEFVGGEVIPTTKITQPILFALSPGNALKTVYLKLVCELIESPIKTATITLQEETSKMTVVAHTNDINLGSVVPVSQDVIVGSDAIVTCTATPGNIIDSVVGADETTGIGTASGTAKIINIRADKHIDVTFRTAVKTDILKAVLSIGYSYADATFDTVTKITRQMGGPAQKDVIGIDGTKIGTLLCPAPVGGSVVNKEYLDTSDHGWITGNDSGKYPDKYLGHFTTLYSNAEVASRTYEFTLPLGTFKFKVLASTINAQNIVAPTYEMHGIVIKPNYVLNNEGTWMEFIVTNTDVITPIILQTSTSTKWKYAPVNIIELYEVV